MCMDYRSHRLSLVRARPLFNSVFACILIPHPTSPRPPHSPSRPPSSPEPINPHLSIQDSNGHEPIPPQSQFVYNSQNVFHLPNRSLKTISTSAAASPTQLKKEDPSFEWVGAGSQPS